MKFYPVPMFGALIPLIFVFIGNAMNGFPMPALLFPSLAFPMLGLGWVVGRIYDDR